MSTVANIQFVFVTGMFRSGTTLLARMLATHSRVAFASDPFAPLFKELRNAVAERLFGASNVDADAPLDDYYFYTDKQRLFAAIQATNLDLPADDRDLAALRERIARHARPYSPKIEVLLGRLTGRSFDELIARGVEIVVDAYGSGRSEVAGFKEVWTGEFAKHLLTAFPQARVVYIVRDPRAVAASKNVNAAKYPWIFLARQWRKLAALAWALQRPSNPDADRVLIMRYEDLIADPETEIARLCAFIGVAFEASLLDVTKYRDGSGELWHQNSAHFDNVRAFNARSVEKWREVLTGEQVSFIESVCASEMELFGYVPERFRPDLGDIAPFMSPPHIDTASLAAWIKPYSPKTSGDVVGEMGREFLRNYVLRNRVPVGVADQRRFCLSEELFDHLQAQQSNATERHQLTI